MIEIVHGDILTDMSEALVNPVNCVGVMGKGLALDFKLAFPENFDVYKTACMQGPLEIGKVFITETRFKVSPKYIVNFPTKFHWREKSRYEYIEWGLEDLVREMIKWKILSVAIPPLGCGLGGLEWTGVKQMIKVICASLPDGVVVNVYAPLWETCSLREKSQSCK